VGSFAALVAHSALSDMQLRIRHEKPASPVHNKEYMDKIVEDIKQTAQRCVSQDSPQPIP